MEQLEVRQVPTTYTWTGGGVDNHWTTLANWSGGSSYPSTSDTANLGSATTVQVNTSITIAHLNLSAGTLDASGGFSVTGNSSWTGGTIANNDAINFGALDINGPVTLDNALIYTGSVTTWSGGNITLNSAVLYLGGTFDIQSDAQILDGGGGGEIFNFATFEKTTATGTTDIEVNFLQNDNITVSSGAIDFSAGTVTLDGTVTGATFDGAAVTVSRGYTSTLDNVAVTAGSLTVAGTLHLQGASTWSGGTIAINSGGHVAVDSGATLDINGTSSMSISGGFVDNDGTVNWSAGDIAIDSTTLTNEAGADFIMADDVNLTDASTIDSSFYNHGTLEVGGVGSAGDNELAVNFSQNSSGTLAVDIKQLSGSIYDQLQIDGTATLDGTLDVRPVAGYSVSSGDVFPVLTAASRSGTFATIDAASFGNSLSVGPRYTSTDADVVFGMASSISNRDPMQPALEPIGEAAVDINQGAVRLSQNLDFDISPGTSIGGSPILTYNSATTNVRPVIEVAFTLDGSLSAPSAISGQLTWNGAAQGWVSFSTAGLTPGNTYVIGLQPTSAVATTGVYPWQMQTDIVYSSRTDITSDFGSSVVVVRDSSVSGQKDAFGAGWGITSIDQLVPTTTGIIWVYGNGDSEFFTGDGTSAYTSPTSDYGTLTPTASSSFSISSASESSTTVTIVTSSATGFSAGQYVNITGVTPAGYDGVFQLASVSGTTLTFSDVSGLGTATVSGATATQYTYDYLAKGVIEEKFDATGRLTSAITTDNLTRNYGYDGSHRITQIVAGDGGTTAFAYSGDFLASITEPGSRTIALTQSGTLVADLTGITDAAGFSRSLGYNGHNQVTSDTWSPYATGFSYDTTTGLLNDVDLGSGSTYTVLSAAAEPFKSSTPMDPALTSVATITDGLTHAATYDLDTIGHVTKQIEPGGASQSWAYSADLLTSYTDANANVTDYGYDTYGQITSVGDPDGGSTVYARDGSNRYDNIISTTQTSSSGNITTTNAYDGSGQLTQSVSGDTFTTTYAWSGHRMTKMVDPDNDTTNYVYDAHLRLTEVDGPVASTSELTAYGSSGNISTYFYFDGADRATKTVDPDSNTTLQSYDKAGNVVLTTDANLVATTQVYDQANNLVTSISGRGYATTYFYVGELVCPMTPRAGSRRPPTATAR